MTASARDVTRSLAGGWQRPRVCLLPEGVEHPDSEAALELVAAAGIVLDGWQEFVLRQSLLQRDGRWAAFAVGVNAPRQNGKNAILEARELVGPLILGERMVIHSAHLADTAKEGFRRLDEILEANEWLSREVRHIWRTNGHEAIEFMDGRRIKFKTRTTGGGRGFSGDCVIFDEAMILPEVSMGAILPVVSAQPNPQIWYTGSAVDQTIHDNGVVFSRVRHRALAGEDKRLLYCEWSLDADNPDDVTEEQAADPESWRVSNPALGIRIDAEYVADERRELDARTFAVERLGVGDYPPLEAGGRGVLDSERWQLLTDDGSRIADGLALCFDVSPDRVWSSIVAAGVRADGLLHCELIVRERGTGWVAVRVAELAVAHEPLAVLCAERSPAASLVRQVEQAGVDVTTVADVDYAKACGELFDLIEQSRLRHLSAPALLSAVKGAATRPLGDAFAWSRKNSTVDISPLVAVTLALWFAAQNPGSGDTDIF